MVDLAYKIQTSFFFVTTCGCVQIPINNGTSETNIIYHRSPIQTEKTQPEGKTDNAENEAYRVSGIIRWPECWNFSVCIGDDFLR